MNDPFLDDDVAYQRLLEDYKKHKSLVIAVDYDNTLFDLHKKGYQFPAVINLLKDAQLLDFKIVIYSASPKERHDSITEYCESLGIKIEGINTDLLDWRPCKTCDYSKSKIYYNILLCDRAGLGSAYKVLRKLVDALHQAAFYEN